MEDGQALELVASTAVRRFSILVRLSMSASASSHNSMHLKQLPVSVLQPGINPASTESYTAYKAIHLTADDQGQFKTQPDQALSHVVT
jgi:hypothetical protein